MVVVVVEEEEEVEGVDGSPPVNANLTRGGVEAYTRAGETLFKVGRGGGAPEAAASVSALTSRVAKLEAALAAKEEEMSSAKQKAMAYVQELLADSTRPHPPR